MATDQYHALKSRAEHAERKALVMHDLHDALGVKWGDDPYARINELKEVETLYRGRAQQERLSSARVLDTP